MSIQDLLSNEPHYVSQLFTSIFYDALLDSAKEIGGSSLTVDIVQTTATSMRKALLWSIIHSSDDTISFQAAYNGMIAAFAAQPVMPNAYILARKLSDIFVQRIFPSAASQPGLPQPTPPAPVQTTKAPVYTFEFCAASLLLPLFNTRLFWANNSLSCPGATIRITSF